VWFGPVLSGPFTDVLKTCCESLVDLKGVPVLDAKGRLTGPALDVLSKYAYQNNCSSLLIICL
jgi:hypothetical protein